MRMRPDLTARQQRYQGQVYWVIKEPVGLHYFRFQEEEYAILQMLDGLSSLDSIKERFEQEFPPQKITVEELGQFVGTLHRSGLVIADVPGQGVQLKKRRDEKKRKELLSALSNILALRFKGIDPDRILNWLHPRLGWMFKPWVVTCCLLFALSALALVTVQFDVFRAKLPSFHQFFVAENWIWLGITLGITKVIHEFGHGLTCKHFGGECHEMGVMILVLTPCLYCNVSDSWMLPNKWHRAWIGAAGMYIEVLIASACTYVWWFTEPGLLNQLCLSTMFVCSVSTIMFNANPLLRYDGYYILSDIAEIPNLRQKASSIFSRKLGAWCLGLEEPEDPFLPQRNQGFFVLYSIAAGIYRWVVLFSILWFLYTVLAPYGLKVLSQMLALASVTSLVVQPLWKIGKFFYVPGRFQQVKRKRLQATLAILSMLVAAAFLIPFPYRIMCTLEVKPYDAEPVYVDVAGRLDEIDVKPGQQVQKGQPLGRLSSVDLQVSIAELEGKRAEYNAKIEGLRRARGEDPAAGMQIPQVKESLLMVEQQLRQKNQDLQRLSLTAPVNGTVLPPPEVHNRPSGGELPNWSGTPLERKNLGAHLTNTVLFCQIGDPRKMQAVLVIDQDDIELIRENDAVDIKLDELPNRTFSSRIEEIANLDLKVTPRQLSNKTGGELITKTDESGEERPQSTSYQARAPLDNADGLMYIGLRGRAKIHVRWQTLAGRGWRYFTRTFNFKL